VRDAGVHEHRRKEQPADECDKLHPAWCSHGVPVGNLREYVLKLTKPGYYRTVEIGQPETERELEVSPLEEPVPTTAPVEDPAVVPEEVPV
jgi:hypothetical protein